MKREQYVVDFLVYGVQTLTQAEVLKIVHEGIRHYVEEETEYSYDPLAEGSLRTDEEHYRAIMNIIGDKENVQVDIPAYAASLIACFQRHDCDVRIRTGRNTWR